MSCFRRICCMNHNSCVCFLVVTWSKARSVKPQWTTKNLFSFHSNDVLAIAEIYRGSCSTKNPILPSCLHLHAGIPSSFLTQLSKTEHAHEYHVPFPLLVVFYLFDTYSSHTGTDDPEPTTPLRSFHGVFTDRYIFRLNFPQMRLPQEPDDQLQETNPTS